MVGFNESRTMGEAAASLAMSNYKNTITNMKRLVGLAFEDPRAQAEMKRLPYECVPMKHASGGPDSIGVKVMYNNEETIVSIEAVAGMMVKHMGGISAAKAAEHSTDSRMSDVTDESLLPNDWVIAVPSYYTDAQKRAFLVGCEISGIRGILRLMNETTATALAYGIFKDIKKEFTHESPTNVLFLDMGATSYSVSVIAFVTGKLIVKSSQYDADLGGRDFDELIAHWIAKQFEDKYKGKISGKPMESPKVRLKLLAAAEKAKKTLSPAGVKEARLNIECLMDDLDFHAVLTADEYEKLSAPLLARLAAPLERALAEAELTPKDLESVEIVGGSTRISCLKRTLAGILGLDPNATNNGLSTTMNADEAVARGAALQSAILSPRFKVLPYEIIEYNPYPVKIAWDAEVDQGVEVDLNGDTEGNEPSNSVVMFDRGSAFPCVRRVTLRRAGEFVVTASYDDSAKDHNFPGSSQEIASFHIKAPAENKNKIRVNVKQDVHGVVTLSSAQMIEEVAEEEAPKAEAAEATEGEDAKTEEAPAEKKKKMKKTNLEFRISRPLDWVKTEIDKETEAEVHMANADRIVRETSDKRNELESYIYDMRDKITSDSQLAPYCTDEEKAAFTTALETNENWLYEDGFDATKSVYAEKLDSLKRLGDPIEFRHGENTKRPNAVAVLQRTVEKYKTWTNSLAGDDKFDHITEEERQQSHAKCDEVSSWMYDMLDKQGSLGSNVDPAVTSDQINDKTKSLSATVSPIMHKPVPKPKPVPVPPPEEAKKEEDPTPMETEPESGGDSSSSAPEPMDTQPVD
eukprot:scaffold107872_cov51-Attheya_sp.AAC.4